MGNVNLKGHTLQLLACLPQPESATGALKTYTQQLTHFLRGELAWQTKELSSLAEFGKSGPRPHDLLLLNEPSWQKLTRPFGKTAVSSAHLISSTLVVREPRWPLRRILLILRGEATDRATIDWGLRLAEHNNCTVTLLVLCPPDPVREEPFSLLKASTVSGRHLRTALHQLAASHVTGVLKVSHGTPEQIVRQEVGSATYDLIILGSEPACRLFLWRLDSLLNPLLQWTQQSILIAKPTFSENYSNQTQPGEQVRL